MTGAGSGRTGPGERERKAARGPAGMAKSAGIVMARTVAGLVAGEIGGQRILKEQCPGEKIEKQEVEIYRFYTKEET